MIDAAGQTTRSTVSTVSVLVLRYRLGGNVGRKGKVDNDWLSVRRQRSVCVRAALDILAARVLRV